MKEQSMEGGGREGGAVKGGWDHYVDSRPYPDPAAPDGPAPTVRVHRTTAGLGGLRPSDGWTRQNPVARGELGGTWCPSEGSEGEA